MRQLHFSIEQAKAISEWLNQQRMERLKEDRVIVTDRVDASLEYQEDFVMYDTEEYIEQ